MDTGSAIEGYQQGHPLLLQSEFEAGVGSVVS